MTDIEATITMATPDGRSCTVTRPVRADHLGYDLRVLGEACADGIESLGIHLEQRLRDTCPDSSFWPPRT